MTSTRRSRTSTTTPAAPRWTTSPAPIPIGSGPCARWREHVGIGGIGPVVVGTPEKVADEMEAWFEATDVDGLNVPFAVSPGDFADIVDMLVPELTRRGIYKSGIRAGHAAGKAVRRRPRAAERAASGRAVSAAWSRRRQSSRTQCRPAERRERWTRCTDTSSNRPVIASEAKQSTRPLAALTRLLRRFAPRNDVETDVAHSRGGISPECCQSHCPLQTKRAQGKPGADRARSPVSNQKRKRTGIDTRFRHSGFPRAMVLRFLRALPGERPFLSPLSCGIPPARIDARVAASGRHDFAVRRERSRPTSQARLTPQRPSQLAPNVP